jgi:RNA polymerase sigma-70 factor (ECF subfamily)
MPDDDLPDDNAQGSQPPVTDSVAQMAQLGLVLQQHRPRLLAMLRRRIDPALAKRIDAEDLLGEVFLLAGRRWQAYSAQASGSPNANAYPWLYRLALDCLIEAWRKETRDCRDLRDELPWPDHSSVQLGLGLVHSGTSPSQAVAREELRQSMKRVLELLPPKDRELLRMRHEDDLSHAEAGQVLGITENAAAVRYMRALQRLRELWNRIHPGDRTPL